MRQSTTRRSQRTSPLGAQARAKGTKDIRAEMDYHYASAAGEPCEATQAKACMLTLVDHGTDGVDSTQVAKKGYDAFIASTLVPLPTARRRDHRRCHTHTIAPPGTASA